MSYKILPYSYTYSGGEALAYVVDNPRFEIAVELVDKCITIYHEGAIFIATFTNNGSIVFSIQEIKDIITRYRMMGYKLTKMSSVDQEFFSKLDVYH